MINPADTGQWGITDGGEVRVFNDRGDFHAVARITEDARPGVIVAPMGYWAMGSRNRHPVSAINTPTFSDTLVEVAGT